MNKKFRHILLTVIFVVFIFLFCILSAALPKKAFSKEEKRYLSDFPLVSAQGVLSGDFETELESYSCDHFAFRNFFVGLNSYGNLLIGNNGAGGVYHCKNGYLINTPGNADRLVDNMEVIAQFAQKTEQPITMLCVPSTGYVMDGVLPANHIKYSDDTYFAQIKTALKNTDVDFVDVRTPFKTASKTSQLYYKTDHHWTTLGAYTAYCELSKNMGFSATDKAQFSVASYGGFYGTTYSSSGFFLSSPDVLEVWDNKENDGSITTVIKDADNSITKRDMFFNEYLDKDDKYPVFIDSNHPLTTITNTQESGENLLVIKDSFANSLVPFLADNFGQITMVDLRYYKESVSSLIKERAIDRVLIVYSLDNLGSDSDIAFLY